MRRRVILCLLSFALAGCASTAQAPLPPTATATATATLLTPLPTIVPTWAKPVIPYSDPPAALSLNQPYLGGSMIIAVTHLDESVDPQTPDIKNSGVANSIPGYQWVRLTCIIKNTSTHPFAPNFDLEGNQQSSDGSGESFLIDAQVVNGLAAPTGSGDPQYTPYLHYATIPSNSAVMMRVYFFLQESGTITVGVYPDDPTLSEGMNAQNFRPIHFFTITLHPAPR